MEKKVSPTSTKNEILKAYNDLLDKIQESKQESPKVEQEKKIRETIVSEAASLTDEKIIGKIKIIEKEETRRKSEE